MNLAAFVHFGSGNGAAECKAADTIGLESAPDSAMDKPSDMQIGEIEDDSGFCETVFDDDAPELNLADGTRVGLGSAE